MVLTIYQLLWIRGTHQLCCLDQILERQYSVQVGEYMGILTPNPTNIYVAFYPSDSMACFSNQNHFAVCCCQVNIFLHQSYELQRAKFHTTQSARACIACQDSKVEKKGRISEHSQSKRTPTVQWSAVSTHPMSLSFEESFTLHSQDTHDFWANTACQDSKLKRKAELEHSQT
jgi:hypothetical protein